MFERFTERARKVVGLAQEEAGRLRRDSIDTEHLPLEVSVSSSPEPADPPPPTFSVSATFRR